MRDALASDACEPLMCSLKSKGVNAMSRAFTGLMILALPFFSQFWSDIAVAAESSKADYPQRPARIIVGFAPGGSDVPARILAQKLGEKLRQPFIVDNRPGARGTLWVAIASQS